MNKQELKTRLIIAQGELRDDIENENGYFDEIAERILFLCFSCDDLLDKSSKDVLVQLDKSVIYKKNNHYIDGFYLDNDRTHIHFHGSSIDDGRELFNYSTYTLEREIVLLVIKELIKMCN